MFLCYQFFNGFSGQALLDGVTSAFYNAFFTALPAGMFAGLDRPVRRLATLEAHPRAYNARPALTAAACWRTAVLTGALHGATVFFVPYLSMRGMGGRPALDDVWTLGKTMFIAMIGVVSLEIALVTRYWTWPFALVWAGSYFLTWPWLAMLPLLYRAAGRWDIAQVGRKAGGGGGGGGGRGGSAGAGPGLASASRVRPQTHVAHQPLPPAVWSGRQPHVQPGVLVGAAAGEPSLGLGVPGVGPGGANTAHRPAHPLPSLTLP